MSIKPIKVFIDTDLSLPIPKIWEILSDTEHVNRLIELPPFNFEEPQVSADAFYRMASMKLFGLTFRWKEHPFDWVLNKRYSVVREFEGGPIDRVWAGVELTPLGEGARIRIFADITPRAGWGILRLLLTIYAWKSVKDIFKFCQKIGTLANSNAESNKVNLIPRLKPTGVHYSMLQRIVRKLIADTPATPEIVNTLAQLIREGTTEEVLRMRPYLLASRWGTDPDETLRNFFYATLCGLLEMDWELMCPNCRIPKAEYRSLSELASRFHCDLCGIDFEADLDRLTELRFSVHPAVRTTETSTYCLGGPANSPHIRLQNTLYPGDEQEVTIDLANEPMRVRVLRYNRTTELNPDPEGATELKLTYGEQGWSVKEQSFRPGAVQVRWKNTASCVQVAVIERLHWDEFAVTAARAMTMKEFRNYFSSEVLDPNRQIGVRNLCILFTDLKGSTQLYEEVGDASAFGNVRRHFDFLIECFERHHGGIVKTIGDAVMASFPTTADALRAAIEVQHRVGEFNATISLDQPLVIKIGLHSGPAIAMNANGSMDYFGRVVNIAARIQGQSEGGDIVMTKEMSADPEIQRVLQTCPFQMQPFEAELKGIGEKMPLVRLIS